MKKIIVIFIVIFSFLFNGCSDRDAQNYAKELVGVLKSYKVEINKKIKAEQNSYKDLAGTYAYAKQMNVQLGLQTERLRRAGELTDNLLKEKTESEITASDMSNLILDYANTDFEGTRQILERESTEQSEYLTGLESLELQSQNIDALIKVLDDLSKPDSNLKKLKDLAAFAQDFKTKMNELDCEEMQRKIACLKEKLKTLEDQKKAEEVRKSAATDPVTIETLQNLIDQLQSSIDKVQTETDRLQSQTKESACAEKSFECPDKQ